ncbi:hypothetical protein [Bradyrhizobium sp. USDA 4454]
MTAMTNNQNTLVAALDQLSADAARIADRVRQLGQAGDGMAGLRLFLTVVEAVAACGVSDQTIYNWIEDAKRMRIGNECLRLSGSLSRRSKPILKMVLR